MVIVPQSQKQLQGEVTNKKHELITNRVVEMAGPQIGRVHIWGF